MARDLRCKIHFNATRLQAVVETEDLELGAGQSWELEEFAVCTHASRDQFTLFRDHPDWSVRYPDHENPIWEVP